MSIQKSIEILFLPNILNVDDSFYLQCLQMGMIKEGSLAFPLRSFFFLVCSNISAVQNQRPSRGDIRVNNSIGASEQTNDDTIAWQILLMMIEWIRHLPICCHLSIHDQV